MKKKPGLPIAVPMSMIRATAAASHGRFRMKATRSPRIIIAWFTLSDE